MQITIEIDDGTIREAVNRYNEGSGVRREDVGFVTVGEAKRVLKSDQMKVDLIDRALELATESCIDMLRIISRAQ